MEEGIENLLMNIEYSFGGFFFERLDTNSERHLLMCFCFELTRVQFGIVFKSRLTACGI